MTIPAPAPLPSRASLSPVVVDEPRNHNPVNVTRAPHSASGNDDLLSSSSALVAADAVIRTAAAKSGVDLNPPVTDDDGFTASERVEALQQRLFWEVGDTSL